MARWTKDDAARLADLFDRYGAKDIGRKLKAIAAGRRTKKGPDPRPSEHNASIWLVVEMRAKKLERDGKKGTIREACSQIAAQLKASGSSWVPSSETLRKAHNLEERRLAATPGLKEFADMSVRHSLEFHKWKVENILPGRAKKNGKAGSWVMGD